jgi:hypothetical protein
MDSDDKEMAAFLEEEGEATSAADEHALILASIQEGTA